MPTLGALDSTFGVVEKGTNAPNLKYIILHYEIMILYQVTAILSAKFSSVMPIMDALLKVLN